MKPYWEGYIIGFIKGSIITIAILLTVFFGCKFYLERLIVDNYVMRTMGLVPDKWFWADKLYMYTYWQLDFHAYDRIMKKYYKKCPIPLLMGITPCAHCAWNDYYK